MADRIVKEQIILNKKIVAAFRNQFNFCPVYFFYDTYSDSIRLNHFNSVVFLNDSLKPESGLNFVPVNFLTAEFGSVDSEMQFDALVIMDEQFQQLKHPFPYYVRTFESLPFRRKPVVVVQKMNESLWDYFKHN